MLIGGKVRLRAISKSDLQRLHEIYTEPDIIGVLSYKADMSLAHFETKLELHMEDMSKRSEWLVIEDNEGTTVGSITYIAKWRSQALTLEDLYITGGHRGKGYGADAVIRLCKYLFEEKDIRRIDATVREDCTAALRVFEKASFFREGVRRNSAYDNGRYINEVMLSYLAREYFAK